MQVLLMALAMLFVFVLLARLVDRFFVPSLDRISSDLKLSSEAAGATLMAVGSSAPELFVALFAVLKPGNHEVIGIGSIVGSALFNILVIVGAVALIKKTKLTWQPILRDILFYFLAVILLLWGILDGTFSILDSLLFIGLYVIYVIAVVYWRKWFKYDDHIGESQSEEEVNCKENPNLNLIDRMLCRIFPPMKNYYWVFLVSIIIIAALSYALVEIAVYASALLNIPEAIIALTVIAVGTSVPDLISSVIVAKQGRGDMGVSNAIGSNIFDILIGLGLPFLIVIVFKGGVVEASNDNLLMSGIILFTSVVILFVSLLISKWKVGRLIGIFLIALYIFYIAREIIIL